MLKFRQFCIFSFYITLSFHDILLYGFGQSNIGTWPHIVGLSQKNGVLVASNFGPESPNYISQESVLLGPSRGRSGLSKLVLWTFLVQKMAD